MDTSTCLGIPLMQDRIDNLGPIKIKSDLKQKENTQLKLIFLFITPSVSIILNDYCDYCCKKSSAR